MRQFADLLRLLGILLGMGTFGLALISALTAGVDPLSALLRAVASSIIVMVIFTILSRLSVPVFGIRDPDKTNEDSTEAKSKHHS